MAGGAGARRCMPHRPGKGGSGAGFRCHQPMGVPENGGPGGGGGAAWEGRGDSSSRFGALPPASSPPLSPWGKPPEPRLPPSGFPVPRGQRVRERRGRARQLSCNFRVRFPRGGDRLVSSGKPGLASLRGSVVSQNRIGTARLSDARAPSPPPLLGKVSHPQPQVLFE